MKRRYNYDRRDSREKDSDRGWNSDDRRKKTDDRGIKTDNRSLKTEDRGRMTEGFKQSGIGGGRRATEERSRRRGNSLPGKVAETTG